MDMHIVTCHGEGVSSVRPSGSDTEVTPLARVAEPFGGNEFSAWLICSMKGFHLVAKYSQELQAFIIRSVSSQLFLTDRFKASPSDPFDVIQDEAHIGASLLTISY